MEAAQISSVPFFTVDYWDRSKFLRPTTFPGAGRGRGRERMYSYGDILRLCIARALRAEQISLETLRRVVDKLAGCAGRLPNARFVLVGRNVQLAASDVDLVKLVARPGRSKTFAILLDLTDLSRTVEKRAGQMLDARRARSPRR